MSDEIQIKTSMGPTETVTLVPKHIPLPGELLQMKARGLGVETIAREIRQSIQTTKQLLNQAQRHAAVQAARDIILRDMLPQIVDNLSAGLDRANANKRDLEVAEYSLKLAERIGLTDMSKLTPGNETKTETLEEFILRRTTKSSTSTDSGEPVVVASTSVDLSSGNAAVDASLDAEVFYTSCEPELPNLESP